jgi:hypothetical protein
MTVEDRRVGFVVAEPVAHLLEGERREPNHGYAPYLLQYVNSFKNELTYKRFTGRVNWRRRENAVSSLRG